MSDEEAPVPDEAKPAVIRELRKIRDMVREDTSLSGHDIAVYALTRANELEGWTS